MSGAIADIGQIFHGVGQLFNPPKAPTLSAPNALSAQPTQAQASQVAIQKNLSAEQTQASTSSLLNGGQGLLDEPKTTSRTLMGA